MFKESRKLLRFFFRSWKQDEYGSHGACRLERWKLVDAVVDFYLHKIQFEKPVYVEQFCRFNKYLASNKGNNSTLGISWKCQSPQDVSDFESEHMYSPRGSRTKSSTCYSHPGKEFPSFIWHLGDWKIGDSINLVWSSKSYSERNPILVNFIVQRHPIRKWSNATPKT